MYEPKDTDFPELKEAREKIRQFLHALIADEETPFWKENRSNWALYVQLSYNFLKNSIYETINHTPMPLMPKEALSYSLIFLVEHFPLFWKWNWFAKIRLNVIKSVWKKCYE